MSCSGGEWAGWGGAVCLPIRHLPFSEEFTASCGQSRTPAHLGLEEGEKRNTVRNRERHGRAIWVIDYLLWHGSAKWKECSRDEPVSLFFILPQEKESDGWRQDGGVGAGFNCVAQTNFIPFLLVGIGFISRETVFISACQHGLCADWHFVQMGCLRKSWSALCPLVPAVIAG